MQQWPFQSTACRSCLLATPDENSLFQYHTQLPMPPRPGPQEPSSSCWRPSWEYYQQGSVSYKKLKVRGFQYLCLGSSIEARGGFYEIICMGRKDALSCLFLGQGPSSMSQYFRGSG